MNIYDTYVSSDRARTVRPLVALRGKRIGQEEFEQIRNDDSEAFSEKSDFPGFVAWLRKPTQMDRAYLSPPEYDLYNSRSHRWLHDASECFK